jgi:hypothetical protein
MSKRTVGLLIAGVGAVVLVVAVAADAVGLSGSGSDGFGTRQLIGTIAGAVVLAAGLVFAYLGRDG